jgi:CsoR family transcriptional regulator, copper-sensing transcriptional repressor
MTPPRGYHVCMSRNIQKEKQVQSLIRRLRIIEGQVKGLQGMIEKDAYCIDVITQTSAVKQALSNVEDSLLTEHLKCCVVNQIKTGNVQKPVKEILKVYQLKRK